ncbi:MAG: CsiV family protein [Pseudomonadota bacterium]|nr:CsiV family protein [Pseudomonadota bacterium]
MRQPPPAQGIAPFLLAAILAAMPFPQVYGAGPDYQVDLVVFTFANPHEDELMTSTPRAPDTATAVRLDERRLPEGFEPVPASGSELSDVVATIKRSSRYRLLGHFIWRQPGLDREMSPAVRVHGGKDYTEEVRRQYIALPLDDPLTETRLPRDAVLEQYDGTVKLGKGRYLHIETDLIYRQPETVSVHDATTGVETSRRELQQYPVKDHRRMRSGELHYIDHPLLGILVKVTRLEGASAPPEPEPEPGEEE